MEPLVQILSEEAPRPVGPYSQAVMAGPFLFISGQLPVDLRTGRLVDGGIGAQTRQVLDHIEAILRAANANFQHLVKVEIYMKDLGEFAEMNAVYAERFPHAVKPARHTVEVAKLPLNARIEIACTAKKD